MKSIRFLFLLNSKIKKKSEIAAESMIHIAIQHWNLISFFVVDVIERIHLVWVSTHKPRLPTWHNSLLARQCEKVAIHLPHKIIRPQSA